MKDVLSSDNFCSNQASFGGAKDSLNNPLQASLLSQRMIALALWPGFASSVPGLYSRAYQRRDWNQKLFFLELIFPYIWHWALAISLLLEPCSFLHIMYSGLAAHRPSRYQTTQCFSFIFVLLTIFHPALECVHPSESKLCSLCARPPSRSRPSLGERTFEESKTLGMRLMQTKSLNSNNFFWWYETQ